MVLVVIVGATREGGIAIFVIFAFCRHGRKFIAEEFYIIMDSLGFYNLLRFSTGALGQTF